MRFQAKNPWAQTLEPQRADLWQLDMSQVVQGIVDLSIASDYGDYAAILKGTPDVDLSKLTALKKTVHFYAQSIDFPRLAISAVEIMKQSKPYNLPGYDEALGEIRISFIHDLDTNLTDDIRRSRIYTLLQAWRGLVRAGRGPMSQELVWSVDSSFKLPQFRYDVGVRFMAGVPFNTADGKDVSEAILNDASRLTDAVEGSSLYVLKKMWLSGLQLGTASMNKREVQTIEATLYADDLQMQ